MSGTLAGAICEGVMSIYDALAQLGLDPFRPSAALRLTRWYRFRVTLSSLIAP
jgi:hypothetical protein